MAEITHTTTTTFGVRCDKRGCGATFDLAYPIDEDGVSYQGKKAIEEQAPAAGWTLWAHRWREWRCPDHPMKPVRRYRYSTHQVLPKPTAGDRG